MVMYLGRILLQGSRRGWVSTAEPHLSLFCSAFCLSSSMLMLPCWSTPTGTMLMPAITADAGLVPCADTGMMHTYMQTALELSQIRSTAEHALPHVTHVLISGHRRCSHDFILNGTLEYGGVQGSTWVRHRFGFSKINHWLLSAQKRRSEFAMILQIAIAFSFHHPG